MIVLQVIRRHLIGSSPTSCLPDVEEINIYTNKISAMPSVETNISEGQ